MGFTLSRAHEFMYALMTSADKAFVTVKDEEDIYDPKRNK